MDQPLDVATAPAATENRLIPFEFHGNGYEYFRIWIVNILLTLVTLGIYSPWAKVRNLRYLYGNTSLDGHRFDYLARPVSILKGRLIAVGVLGLFLLSNEFAPALVPVWIVLFVFVLPWVICRAMIFRNHNTSYRNLRFGFDGRYGGAFSAYVLWMLLGFATAGLLLPAAFVRQKRFLVANARYGTSRFVPDISAWDFYPIYLVGGFIFVATGLVVGFGTALLPELLLPLLIIVSGLGYAYAVAFIRAETTNIVYNQSRIEGHRFVSSLNAGWLAWLYASNIVLILVTLGLGLPWARVRLARYQAQCLQLSAAGSLDDFIAGAAPAPGALGEELGEVFDIDIGL